MRDQTATRGKLHLVGASYSTYVENISASFHFALVVILWVVILHSDPRNTSKYTGRRGLGTYSAAVQHAACSQLCSRDCIFAAALRRNSAAMTSGGLKRVAVPCVPIKTCVNPMQSGSRWHQLWASRLVLTESGGRGRPPRPWPWMRLLLASSNPAAHRAKGT